ncbi:MAG TPA: Spy/CpxP family protein refolding chaperone [Stellaceae bacterium]|nr:Spy/CpxP family protein refolding chaperone [Stellaceae bacterium]
MKHRLSGAIALALIAATGGSLALLDVIPLASAQTTPDQASPRHPGPRPTEHIEGKLAFLKTELKITPAQEPQWGRLAAVIRDGAAKMEQSMARARADRDNASAIQRLEMGVAMADARAAEMHAVLDAAQPLYATFTDEQKKAADTLMPHHGWGGPHHP